MYYIRPANDRLEVENMIPQSESEVNGDQSPVLENNIDSDTGTTENSLIPPDTADDVAFMTRNTVGAS
jgi:hypothetical protein